MPGSTPVSGLSVSVFEAFAIGDQYGAMLQIFFLDGHSDSLIRRHCRDSTMHTAQTLAGVWAAFSGFKMTSKILGHGAIGGCISNQPLAQYFMLAKK
jgi:hypothetical protein